MKTFIFTLILTATFLLPVLPQATWAGGYGEDFGPRPARVSRKKAKGEPEPEVPAPPSCVPTSQDPKVRIVSWNPRQKVSKFLGEITECVTTMWDVLRILPGPNIINVAYPSEKEQWGYNWMWSYKLQNPLEDTVILMDNPGKRIRKGKNPVELYLVFNENDVVERVSMMLIKKKNSEY